MLQHEAEYIDARPLTTDSSNLLATHGRTIHLGQKQTSVQVRVMSALPPIADITVGPPKFSFAGLACNCSSQKCSEISKVCLIHYGRRASGATCSAIINQYPCATVKSHAVLIPNSSIPLTDSRAPIHSLRTMSALPPKADIGTQSRDVR